MKTLALLACCAALAGAAEEKKKGEVSGGKKIFDGQCAVCHATATDQKKLGPSLKNLFKNAKMADGKKPTEANVRAKIDAGGSGMPAYKEMLSAEEKDDLIAYLKTL